MVHERQSKFIKEDTGNYYDILGVSPTADHKALRKRYRQLALENHPDRFPDGKEKRLATEKFKAIRTAFEILSNPGQRSRYDASVRRGKPFTTKIRVNADSSPSLAEVFADIDRFKFPSRIYLANVELSKLLNENLINTDSFQEKVLDMFSVTDSDIARAPVAAVRGEKPKATHLVLTNLRLIVVLDGVTIHESYNTAKSYTGVTLVSLDGLELIELNSVPDGIGLEVRVFGPESALTNVSFKVEGSPIPFLWIAELYGIGLKVGMQCEQATMEFRETHKKRLTALPVLSLVAIVLLWIGLGGREDSAIWTSLPILLLLCSPILVRWRSQYLDYRRRLNISRLYQILTKKV